MADKAGVGTAVSDHRWDNDGNLVLTGPANAYLAGTSRTITGYYPGLRICGKINVTNTSASTLKVDDGPVVDMRKTGNAAIASGDLVLDNFYDFIYDEVNAVFKVQGIASSVTGGSTPIATQVENVALTPVRQVQGATSDSSSDLQARFSADAAGPYKAFAKSRGATVGTHTVVQNDDILGIITAAGSDGTNFAEAARIQFEVDGTPGAGDMPGAIVFKTSADGTEAPIEGFRLTAEQNLQAQGQGFFSRATLTDAATIDWNLNTQQVARITLGGNRTLNNPTNQRNGATYVLDIIQDGAGSRTLAFDTAYQFPGGTAPTLSTGLNAVDVMCCESTGTKMRCTVTKNFLSLPPSGTFLQQANQTGAASTFTFSSQSFGAAHSERTLVCAITADTTPVSIVSATIGGIAATVDVAVNSVAEFAAVISATVPTGTSGSVVITFNTTATDCSIGLFRLLGLNSQTPTGTTSNTVDPAASTLTVSANGFIVGCASFDNDTTVVTTVGVTENWDLDIGSSRSVGGFFSNGGTAEVGRTVSFDGGATNAVGVWAAYR